MGRRGNLLLVALAALAAGIAWWAVRSRAAGGDGARRVGVDEPVGAQEAAALTAPDSARPEPVPDGEAPASRRKSLAGLTGRVLDAETDAPVAGFRVQLCSEREVLAVDVSDAAGRFAFPPPGDDARWIELEPRTGWVRIDARIELAGLDPGRPRDLVLRVGTLGSSPVRGIVVDRATDEPLPDFLLQIEDGDGVRHLCRTDADGRFETDEPAVAGSLTVLAFDHPAFEGRRDYAGVFAHGRLPGREEVEELRIAVAVGPTYRLDLVLPAALEMDRLEAYVVWQELDARTESRSAPLREGPLPWVRFRKLEMDPRAVPPWFLHLRTRDGLWAGSSEVDRVVGIAPDPVRVDVTARGEVHGRVLAPDGEPVRGVRLSLTPESVSARRRQAFTGSNGAFAFSWLEPGSWALRASALRHFEADRALDVRGAEPVEVDLVLEPMPVAGDVRGRLVVPREQTEHLRNDRAALELASVDDPHRTFEVIASPDPKETNDERRWTFAFERLPPGDYELRVISPWKGYWDPPSVKIAPPRENLEFRLRAPGREDDLLVRVVDAATRERLDFVLIVRRGGPSVEPETVRVSAWRLSRSPPGTELEWIVGAPGYRPRRGDHTRFQDHWGKEELELELEPGWGAVLRVVHRTADGLEPLQDVALRLDDEGVGRTAADGVLEAELGWVPERVEVVQTGWRLVGGDVRILDRTTGSLPPDRIEYVLELAPEE